MNGYNNIKINTKNYQNKSPQYFTVATTSIVLNCDKELKNLSARMSVLHLVTELLGVEVKLYTLIVQ